MSDKHNPHDDLFGYIERTEAIAATARHHAAALVKLNGVLGEASAVEWPTGPGTAEDRLFYLLLGATDAACTMAETPAPAQLPRSIRELLVGLVELTTDEDHGVWDGAAVTALREKARKILLDGV